MLTHAAYSKSVFEGCVHVLWAKDAYLKTTELTKVAPLAIRLSQLYIGGRCLWRAVGYH